MKNFIFTFVYFFCTLLSGQTVYDWIPISQVPNKMVYSFSEYQGKLITSGMFDTVGAMPVNRIAAWDGTNWSSLGKGVRGGNTIFETFVYDSRVYNNELYVWGDFDSAGTVLAKDIAKWDGASWSSIGGGSDLSIYCTAFYNNQLYVGGTFDSIGGVSAKVVAMWNGSTWQAVGNNSLKASYGTGFVNDLYVFQNELYATGLIDSVNGQSCRYIAKWNGTAWDTVSSGMNWFSTAFGGSSNQPNFVLTEWNGKLLVGSTSPEINFPYSTDIYQWNGLTWSLFSNSTQMDKIRRFYKYNNELYASGGIAPNLPDKSNVWKWSSSENKWNSVGSGVNKSVRALGTYNGEFYCGGNFNRNEYAYFNFIAKLGNVTGINEVGETIQISVFPNPSNGRVVIELKNAETREVKLNISNSLGQLVYTLNGITKKQEIDLSDFPKGIYFLQIKNKDGHKVVKFIRD